MLTTNRPEWAEFAFKQYQKFGGDLVVLDNAQKPNPFWKCADEYFHLPELENTGQMFNHFSRQYQGYDHLFYMDDDIQIRETLRYQMEKWLDQYHLIFLNQVFVTCGNKSALWVRRNKNIGAAFLISREIWQTSYFNEKLPCSGVIQYFAGLVDCNIKNVHQPMANYFIHDKNLVMRENHFNFNLPKVDFDDTRSN